MKNRSKKNWPYNVSGLLLIFGILFGSIYYDMNYRQPTMKDLHPAAKPKACEKPWGAACECKGNCYCKSGQGCCEACESDE